MAEKQLAQRERGASVTVCVSQINTTRRFHAVLMSRPLWIGGRQVEYVATCGGFCSDDRFAHDSNLGRFRLSAIAIH